MSVPTWLLFVLGAAAVALVVVVVVAVLFLRTGDDLLRAVLIAGEAAVDKRYGGRE
jgi:cell division septal protein FtsQ